MTARALALAPMGLLVAAAAGAQDFATAAPPGAGGALAFVEHGQPPTATSWSIETATVRWFGSPELVTRALAARGAWRPARWAIGLSRTGGDELGWSAAAAAAGVSTPDRAAALRVCVRQDADAEPGTEFGLGAWSEVREPLRLWISAPQVWTDGAAPPLERHLELGLEWAAHGAQAWLSRAAAPAGADGAAADHAAGIALASRGLLTWITLRDRPMRGGFGIAAQRGVLRAAVAIESHPVLPETVRLTIGWESRPGKAPAAP